MSQGSRQKLARIVLKSSCEHGVFWVFRDLGWAFEPLLTALSMLAVFLTGLVAHLTALGDTIAAIPPYSAIPSRGRLEPRYPLPLPSFGCDRASLGGYRAIPCDI